MVSVSIEILLLSIFLLLCLPKTSNILIKQIGLFSSFFLFFFSLVFWIFFDQSTSKIQFVEKFSWLFETNNFFVLGLNGISLFFIILTTLLIPVCLLASWNIELFLKEYFIAFLILEIFLILVFCVSDVFLFYIFFESVLIPMYLIIGIWGSRQRKIRAAYLFFLYTLFGSLVMLSAIGYLYTKTGTTDYESLLNFQFAEFEQKILWLAFFFSFASKIPMFPVHLWLPEAHVEAPTAGSVVLAGILLKLGVFGFVKFSIPLFSKASYFFTPIVLTFSVIGIIYGSFTAIRQSDFKRIIAYTSIAHMNLVVMGIFSFNLIGLEGAIIQSISHGFVSSALFLIIGIVYDRYHTRTVRYFGGIAQTMPIFVIFFLIFSMANIALPGTSSFVGEFLILCGVFKQSPIAGVFGALGIVLSGAYSLWLFNRISYGNVKIFFLEKFLDLNKREFFVLLPLLLGTLFLGIFPQAFLEPLHMSIAHLLEVVQTSME
uniref:NADH-ubiquinone oxidoreductase chain 4 n=1 Tax=Aureoumbra lagunensis TaxID=44058 RepID=A0A7U0KSG6_9STRA|nr:NADH dehydrogenase subunit 4 [Aureoumbra lagunensis]QQW50389.1 NADH dehydrogenase subunit 4 [Aureoumbra lagunensis]